MVVYDDWAAHAAGRAWWLLRHHGHHDVRVLDGGWSAWVADGGEVETGAVEVAAGRLHRRPGRLPVVEADRVLDVPVLVDARAPERYRGETEPIDPVAGRIPGAVNVFDRQQPRATTAGSKPARSCASSTPRSGATRPADGEVAVYCGSGVTAIHDLIALELARRRRRALPRRLERLDHRPGRPVDATDATSGCP